MAGRTDAGVHARGQVASYELPAAGTVERPGGLAEPPGGRAEPPGADNLNGLLPPDIRILLSERAPEGFNARFSALSRTYRYRILSRAVASPFERRYAFHVHRQLDEEALHDCAAALIGTHDFTAFTPTETDHVRFERDVYFAGWRAESDEVLAFWIEADSFMRHMVRVLVGSMLAVARGRQDVAWFKALLEGAPRSEAAETAPPQGLFLEAVRYT